MTGSDALTTYCSGVPAIAASFGSPSNSGGVIVVSLTSTFAVWGIWSAMRDSAACDVPGTDALTFSFGLSSGMFAKSAGSARPETYSHGPLSEGPRYQRPEIRIYVC